MTSSASGLGSWGSKAAQPMSKDELIAALRNHRKQRSAKNDAPTSRPPNQERTPDRRTYEERTLEELRERAQ